MKKIFAIVMAVCLIVSALCITASATSVADPADNIVMRVTALKSNNEVYYPAEYDFTDFEKGWNSATELANNENIMKTNKLERVVVELYADWDANEKGEFGDSDGLGFQWSAIYVPEKNRITINMNGHTIDRGLDENELDGEVICVDDKADLVINNGTITGGNSDNGAGGIHVSTGASITLNNVNITGNVVDDDDGGAIALYDGATLIMKDGSISNNTNNSFVNCYGAGVYVYNSTASFENVTFHNNQNKCNPSSGTVIYADENSNVTMNKCQVTDNGTLNDTLGTKGAISTIVVTGSSELNIKDTTFRGNGYAASAHSSAVKNALIEVGYKSYLSIDTCTFTANSAMYLLVAQHNKLDIVNSSFLNNAANVFCGYPDESITFTNCTFNNNPGSKWDNVCSFDLISDIYGKVTFINCDMGNSLFNDRSLAEFNDDADSIEIPEENTSHRLSSIFAEGSPAMIFAILALVTSAVSIFLTIVYNKKKIAPTTSESVEEAKDE